MFGLIQSWPNCHDSEVLRSLSEYIHTVYVAGNKERSYSSSSFSVHFRWFWKVAQGLHPELEDRAVLIENLCYLPQRGFCTFSARSLVRTILLSFLLFCGT